MDIEFLTNMVVICGVCVAVVNVIVEVLKTFLLKKDASKPLAVFCVSEAVTFLALYAYMVIEKVAFKPILIVGAFVGGFFVAYGAMFGYDKLYGELFEKLKQAVSKHKSNCEEEE